MIKREWLLGVGLLSGSVLSAGGLAGLIDPATAQADDTKIGAVGAVNTAAIGQLQGGASQTLFVGADVFQNQTVRTDANGLAEIMFTDQSTITVGHGSEVVLDNFVYDPNNEVGQLAVSLSQGAMRFIGGKISKTTPVKVNAPTATLTIRGGIGLLNFPAGQNGIVAFLYGIEMTVTGRNGTTRSIRQPGYGVIVPAGGGDPSEPFRLTDAQLAALRQQFESNSPEQGGAPIDPLKPIRNFGSNDTFKPDNPLLNTGVGNNSILNGVVVDTSPIS
ncbi:MAG TPA: FecR family protein [Terriglobia bacterium]|nr:FecR family protein [Terriglobia bacterium]